MVTGSVSKRMSRPLYPHISCRRVGKAARNQGEQSGEVHVKQPDNGCGRCVGKRNIEKTLRDGGGQNTHDKTPPRGMGVPLLLRAKVSASGALLRPPLTTSFVVCGKGAVSGEHSTLTMLSPALSPKGGGVLPQGGRPRTRLRRRMWKLRISAG